MKITRVIFLLGRYVRFERGSHYHIYHVSIPRWTLINHLLDQYGFTDYDTGTYLIHASPPNTRSRNNATQ